MSKDGMPGAGPQMQEKASADTERREALIKLGKYMAYATPIVLASASAAHSTPAPVSGPTPPAPPPSPPSP